MYGRAAAAAIGASVISFVAGAAAMGNYTEHHTPAPDTKHTQPGPGITEGIPGIPGIDGAVGAVGDGVTHRACRMIPQAGLANGWPVVSQLRTASDVAVDSVAGVTGSGECSPPGG